MSLSLKLIDFQQTQVKVQKKMRELVTNSFVTVGIHESAQQPDGGDMTMAELGALQHFGSMDGKIPARRWLDVGVASGNEEYADTVAEGIAKKQNPRRVLSVVGNLAVGYAQQYIDDLTTPKNAPSTIARKGVDNPLVDTGAMKQSVTFELTDTKPQEGL